MPAMSPSERCVRCRISKSRTVDRMVFSAEGLTAGVKLQNSSLFRELLSVRPGTNRIFRIAWHMGVDRLESPVTRWVAPIREVPNVDRRDPSPTRP